MHNVRIYADGEVHVFRAPHCFVGISIAVGAFEKWHSARITVVRPVVIPGSPTDRLERLAQDPLDLHS